MSFGKRVLITISAKSSNLSGKLFNFKLLMHG